MRAHTQHGAVSASPPQSAVSARVATGAVVVMLLWALCFPLIAAGLAAAPPMSFATLRAALAGGVLLALAEFTRRPPILGAQVWAGLIVVGLTATTLGFVGMFYGGGLVSPGLATVIANTQPLIAAALAWVFLDERLGIAQRLGLTAGFAGIVLIGAPGLSGSSSQLVGTALIVTAAMGIAISNVVLKRLAGRVDPLRAMGWQLVIGSVPLAMLALAVESPDEIVWSGPFVLNLMVLSVLGTAAAFWLWFELLRRESLSQLNVYTFLTPAFGLLMGRAFFDERIHPLALAGIALSVLGIVAVNRGTAERAGRSLRDGKSMQEGESLPAGKRLVAECASRRERRP